MEEPNSYTSTVTWAQAYRRLKESVKSLTSERDAMRAVVEAALAWMGLNKMGSSYGADIDLRNAIDAYIATQAKDEK